MTSINKWSNNWKCWHSNQVYERHIRHLPLCYPSLQFERLEYRHKLEKLDNQSEVIVLANGDPEIAQSVEDFDLFSPFGEEVEYRWIL